MPTAPVLLLPGTEASPCSLGRHAGLLRARAVVTTPRSKPRVFVFLMHKWPDTHPFPRRPSPHQLVSSGSQDPQVTAGPLRLVGLPLPWVASVVLPRPAKVLGVPRPAEMGQHSPARSVLLPKGYEPRPRWGGPGSRTFAPTRGAAGTAAPRYAAPNASLRPQARPPSEVTPPATLMMDSCEGSSAVTAPPSPCSR